MMEQAAVQDTITLKTELVRKAIHLVSLSIPVIYYFISKELAIWIIMPVTAIFIIADLARYEVPQFSGFFYKFFGFLLRKHEIDEKKRSLNGATFMLISAAICIAIFPKYIMVSSFPILILGDAASAVFGKRFGKHKILSNGPKSYEGSLAFVIAGMVAVALTPKVNYIIAEYLIGIAATIVASIAEALSYRIIDDNIAVPISFGLTMWALYVIFLPHLNLFFMK
ncbi:MAG: diacylglycerol/polyprenol kinase family protein [Candidatus Kryptoniota bacterium]